MLHGANAELQATPLPPTPLPPRVLLADVRAQEHVLDAITRGCAYSDAAAAAAASDVVREHLRKHPNLHAAKVPPLHLRQCAERDVWPVQVGGVAASILNALGLKRAAATLRASYS